VGTHNYVGDPLVQNKPSTYRFAKTIPADGISLAGTWTTDDSYFEAGDNAQLRLRFPADDVYLVLAGQGTVTVSVDGGPGTRFTVSGTPNSYPLVTGSRQHGRELTATLGPGLRAYDLTFG
jgi:Thioredoxin like C-terminal domain